MTGLEGNSEFCIPETLNVFLASGSIDFELKQNSLFPAESVIECFVRSPNSKIEKKIAKKRLLDAGWHTNLLQFQ